PSADRREGRDAGLALRRKRRFRTGTCQNRVPDARQCTFRLHRAAGRDLDRVLDAGEQLQRTGGRYPRRDGPDLRADIRMRLQCRFTNTSARIAERSLKSWCAASRTFPTWSALPAAKNI